MQKYVNSSLSARHICLHFGLHLRFYAKNKGFQGKENMSESFAQRIYRQQEGVSTNLLDTPILLEVVVLIHI